MIKKIIKIKFPILTYLYMLSLFNFLLIANIGAPHINHQNMK